MSDPEKTITEFVLAQLDNQPPRRRAELYRALARLISDEAAIPELVKLADDLDAIQRRHRQLTLNLTS